MDQGRRGAAMAAKTGGEEPENKQTSSFSPQPWRQIGEEEEMNYGVVDWGLDELGTAGGPCSYLMRLLPSRRGHPV